MTFSAIPRRHRPARAGLAGPAPAGWPARSFLAWAGRRGWPGGPGRPLPRPGLRPPI